MPNKFIRDVKEVLRRLRNRGIELDGNRQYPAIPTIDNSIESHTSALRALREAVETHERRNPRAALDSFVRLYELEDVLGGFQQGESSVTNVYGSSVEFATPEETDEGVLETKAIHPFGGAYAYDRFRHAGQHAAGKGTQTVTVAVVAADMYGEFTIDGHLSNVFRLVLDGDSVLLNPVNPINGQTINIHLIQGIEGGHRLIFDDQWKFTNRITPELTQDAGAEDMLSCQWDETAGVMKCSFLPNYGSGYTPPPDPSFEDLVFVNVGSGNEVFRDVDGLNVNLRTIVGDGDVDVTTVGDTIVVNYSAPEVSDLSAVPFIIDGDVSEYPGLPNIRGITAGDNIEFDRSTEGVLSISSTATGIPPGGTTGQLLGKSSDDDLDVAWVDPPEGGGGGGGGGAAEDITYDNTFSGLDAADVQAAIDELNAVVVSGGVGVGDTLFNDVVLLCKFEGADGATTALDLSEDARTLTFNGNAQLDDAEKKWGDTSLLLDGTGDYVSIDHSADLSVSSGDVTIEAWVKRSTSGAVNVHTISNKRSGSSAQEHSLSIGTDDTVNFSAFSGGASVATVNSAPVTIVDDGEFHHIAATRQGSTWRLFIDGVHVGTDIQSGSPSTNSSPLLIGRDGFNTGRDFQGWIDSYRFTRACRYTDDFTVPANDFPTLSGQLGEAPLDGQQYARQDGGWATIDPPTYPIDNSNIQLAVQAADLVKTNNTLTDTDLVLVLTPGRYVYECRQMNTSHATPDATAVLTYSGTVTHFEATILSNQIGSNAAVNRRTSIPDTLTLTVTNAVGTTYFGVLEVATGGTLKWQWGQITTSAIPVTFHRGNWMRLTKIDAVQMLYVQADEPVDPPIGAVWIW